MLYTYTLFKILGHKIVFMMEKLLFPDALQRQISRRLSSEQQLVISTVRILISFLRIVIQNMHELMRSLWIAWQICMLLNVRNYAKYATRKLKKISTILKLFYIYIITHCFLYSALFLQLIRRYTKLYLINWMSSKTFTSFDTLKYYS